MKKLWFVLLTAILCLGLSGIASAQPPAPMYVAPGGQGDALIGEFYRAYGDDAAYVTFFTIANTSDTRWIEIHVTGHQIEVFVELLAPQQILRPAPEVPNVRARDRAGV